MFLFHLGTLSVTTGLGSIAFSQGKIHADTDLGWKIALNQITGLNMVIIETQCFNNDHIKACDLVHYSIIRTKSDTTSMLMSF